MNFRRRQSPPNSAFSCFHMMAKPIGPVCNLNCTYCYYLSKKDFYKENEQWRIADDILEEYIKQYINEQNCKQINFSWQGGEPTLLGIDFFRKVVKLQKKYSPSDKIISNDIQTNGTLLNVEWCEFLHDNRFLVGLSIDGPSALNDKYRIDKNQQSNFYNVVAAAQLLKKYKVEFNTLTVVNRTNAKRPLDVYKFLRTKIGSTYMQFIPCVEPKEFTTVAPQFWDENKLPKVGDSAACPGTSDSLVTEWSVDPDDYGYFLCKIFDRWYRNDVGKVFIINFEASINLWVGRQSPVCYFAKMCGKSLAIEHDGNVYSCDHYVYPEYKLGNIKEQSLSQMAFSERQMRFGLNKSQSLPRYCRDCKFLFACHGECPKNRILRTLDGEFGLNYLCTGLKKYFQYIDPYIKLIIKEIQLEQHPAAEKIAVQNR